MVFDAQNGQDFTIPIDGLPPLAKQLEMGWLPSGDFVMGCDKTNKFYVDTVSHQFEVVHTKGFWLSRYVITVSQWDTVMKNSASEANNHPVVNVDWNDAMSFCKHLNDLYLTDLRERHARLPTEAEWEYALWLGSNQQQMKMR